MDKKAWDQLLRRIEDGSVVPVLGHQVLTSADEGDSLQKQIAQYLMELYEIEPDKCTLTPSRELNDVVIQIKQERSADIQELYADIHDAIRHN